MAKTEWMKLIQDLCKKNPGKPLGAIIPLARKMYKPDKNAVSGTEKKSKKMNRSFRRKSYKRGKK
jgi:hypothetical protein